MTFIISNFMAKMGIRGSRDVLADADRLHKALGMSYQEIENMRQKDAEINRMLRTGLSFLTTIQIARFALINVQQIASGKGGISDIMSLAMSAILLTFQLKAVIQETLIYQAMLNMAAMTTVGWMGGILPVAGTLAVVAGSQLLSNYQAGKAMEDENAQRVRIQLYRSIVGN